MVRNRLRNEKTDVEIYVILSSISNEFYVGKTKNPNHYQAYKDHVRLKNQQTKELFSRSLEAGACPKMYLLEIVNATKTEAYSRCVVWTKYFLEHGLSPVAAQTTVEYARDLTDENQEIFDRIKNESFENLINESTLLVSNYEPRNIEDSERKKNKITISVTPEEFDIIESRAEEEHLTLSKYCKEMVLAGLIVRFDMSENLREIREIKKILREVQLAIYQNGRYYPADLENLQKLVESINKSQNKVVKSLASHSKELKKLKQTKDKLSRKVSEKEELKGDETAYETEKENETNP